MPQIDVPRGNVAARSARGCRAVNRGLRYTLRTPDSSVFASVGTASVTTVELQMPLKYVLEFQDATEALDATGFIGDKPSWKDATETYTIKLYYRDQLKLLLSCFGDGELAAKPTMWSQSR